MVKLKKYNLAGEAIGEVELSEAISEVRTNGQLIKDYIVAMRRNARQWSACTKDRSQVNHSKKKPHRQKGLGRARQGSLAAPHFRGGGRPFGPRPKFDQHVRINRKERRQAIYALIAEKAREGRMIVVQDIQLSEPSTKTIARFVKGVQLEGRTLILAEAPREGATGQHGHLSKSIRNIPTVQFSLVATTNGYQLLNSRSLVLTESALSELNSMAQKV